MKDVASSRVTFIHQGVKLQAAISPVCFMREDYPLQVQVARDLEHYGHDCAFMVDKTVRDMSKVTKAQVIALAKTCVLSRCAATGDLYTGEKARPKKWTCWAAKQPAMIDARLAESLKEDAAERRRIARMFAKGYNYQVLAWVHPKSGDDHQIEFYTETKPTAAYIKAYLKEQGSQVLDDYMLFPIFEEAPKAAKTKATKVTATKSKEPTPKAMKATKHSKIATEKKPKARAVSRPKASRS